MNRARRSFLAAALFLLSSACAAADGTEDLVDRQHRPWQPPAPIVETPLWPEDLAIARPATPGDEAFGTGRTSIAGRPFTMVEHVSRPTMAIYRPRGANTGTAVLVFPGGGYRALAIDLEGTEVCDWLVAKAVTCVVLKYRVPGSGPYWSEDCNCRRIPAVPMALQDAQRALGLLRQRGPALGIDPHRIGVLGFSAGGRMVVDISNTAARSYAPVDAADRQSSRPDFAIALYPGHLWKPPGLGLEPSIRIDPNGPPTLVIQAGDDPTDDVRHSLAYYLALQQANVPVELHLFAAGGHAFGLRRSAAAITGWPGLAERWLVGIGMLPGADPE
jgi:acetyl esterase/lipase